MVFVVVLRTIHEGMFGESDSIQRFKEIGLWYTTAGESDIAQGESETAQGESDIGVRQHRGRVRPRGSETAQG